MLALFGYILLIMSALFGYGFTHAIKLYLAHMLARMPHQLLFGVSPRVL